jgi:hypothetical protein
MNIITHNLKYGKLKHLKTRFEKIESNKSIIISDQLPTDPKWIKVCPGDLMKFVDEYDIWYKRKVEYGNVACYIRSPHKTVSCHKVFI